MEKTKETNESVKTVGRVNAIDILIVQETNGEKRVPIKPICEALGVDFSSQLQRLKNDPVFSSTMVLSTTVGADGKNREMQTLPHKYIFGWLFRIDSRNVKEEARENLIKYQLLCNDILYSYFELRTRYIEERQIKIEEQRERIDEINERLQADKEELSQARKNLKMVREMDFDAWREEQQQLALNFSAN